MHDYNTILGVIELRLSKVSYDTVKNVTGLAGVESH